MRNDDGPGSAKHPLRDVGGSRLEAMACFVAVAAKLSFVEAAHEIDVSPSAVSRRIARFEERLGVRLFNRTTRQVSLTEAGALFRDRCQDVLWRVDDAEAVVSTLGADPRGTLRLSAPGTFGPAQIAPLLSEFRALYPKIRLEFTFTDRIVDLLEEGLDAAIRIGALDSSRLIARRLAPNRRLLCASPAYLDRRGVPESPHDLCRHDCLHFSRLATGEKWQFERDGDRISVSVNVVILADNAEVLKRAAVDEAGIAYLSTFVAGDDLRAKRLVSVLHEWRVVPETAIWIVYPHARFLPLKVRVLVDFLVDRLAGSPSWDRDV